jgi:hypothetical protein
MQTPEVEVPEFQVARKISYFVLDSNWVILLL